MTRATAATFTGALGIRIPKAEHLSSVNVAEEARTIRFYNSMQWG